MADRGAYLYIHNIQVHYLYYTQYIRYLTTFRDIRQVEIHIFFGKTMFPKLFLANFENKNFLFQGRNGYNRTPSGLLVDSLVARKLGIW